MVKREDRAVASFLVPLLCLLVTAASMLLCIVAGPFRATAQGPTLGGTAVMAIVADSGQFNPAITTSSNLHAVAAAMFNGLMGLDRETYGRCR
jgi:hypothetical protein